MRLDKFLCEMNLGTRSQVRTLIRQGLVTVNGSPAGNGDLKIDEQQDRITFRGKPLVYRRFVYYMLHKPKGTVSATADSSAPAVTSLLGANRRDGLFPVGRLDKDTTGLLLITNDGELAHRLLSPRRHVDKCYLVRIARPLSPEDTAELEQGVDIGEESKTLPARVEIVEAPPDVPRILLTIHEGKFHQVKRMLQAVNNEVLELERVAFGGVRLDSGLAPGEYRELTEEELALLRRAAYEKQQEKA